MTGSVLTLVIGLALLGLAIWLLWRAGAQGSTSADSATSLSTPPSSRADDSTWEQEERGVEQKNGESRLQVPDAPTDVRDTAPEDVEGLAENRDDVSSPATEVGVQEDSGAAREAEEGFRFLRTKKRRRGWAQELGFEYLREDRRSAQEIPEALLQVVQPESLVLRDVVAGFYEGYEITIGDLAGATMLRMRRPGHSPVSVYYSVAGAVPAGMRRAELLDQPPFYGFTTDIRALDRMLDERVEDSLAALAHVVSDVIWEDDWVVVRMSRKLDTSVWEQVLPVVRTLADAAMVLPPLIMSTPLAMDVADPTRSWPNGAFNAADGVPEGKENTRENLSGPTALEGSGGAPFGSGMGTERGIDGPASNGDRGSGLSNAEKGNKSKQRPGHLRPVEEKSSRTADVDEQTPVAEDRQAERPHIERPAGPVEFPTRSQARTAGDWDEEDFPLRDENHGSIPSLGEDPNHISGSNSQYSRVIRVDQETAIFGNELSQVAQARRRKGRHRAPDARHARPEPIEPVEAEIETIDGEIVENED